MEHHHRPDHDHRRGTGKLALRGTQSSGALVAIGVALLGWGIFSLVRNKNS